MIGIPGLRAAVATTVLVWLLLPAIGRAKPDKIEVCHVPPGRPDRVLVVRVGDELSLADHLGHGDSIFGTGLAADCSGGLSLRIDEDIEPDMPLVAGLAGGAHRPVAVLVGPDGSRDEFVEGEIDFKPESEAELETFLALYAAEVLRGDVTLVATESGEVEERPGGGWYLLRIDPQTSSLLDLPGLLAARGAQGDFSFSSAAAARTVACWLRESDRTLTPNLVFEPQAIPEHPLVANPSSLSDFLDFAELWFMTEDDDPSTPGDQGLSIGVARAWDYLRHTGLPPENGLWEPARVAIVDGGYELDPVTGLGNLDFDPLNNPPLQVDLVDFDNTAGGPDPVGPGFHGQYVFGVCCAWPRNRFGGAGRGGEYVRPIPIRAATAWADTALAIRTAWLMHADVINISFTFVCSGVCDLDDILGESQMVEEVRRAMENGTSVIAAAGNGPDNMTMDFNVKDGVFLPCELPGVLCVGAIDPSGDNVWNWGSNVDIWAPEGTQSTVWPGSDEDPPDGNDFGADELPTPGGTSFATPFVAGIAGMLKAADPSLEPFLVKEILQDTANPTRDEMIRAPYVDALRAVQAVRPNPPPTVRFSQPHDGDQRSWARPIDFTAILSDPPAPQGFVGSVVFDSDLDGAICSSEADRDVQFCEGRLETLGTHVVSATATDEFGAASTASIRLELTNAPPRVTLQSPTDGSTRFADQQGPFRAQVDDFDGELFDALCPVSPGSPCVEWSSSRDGALVPSSGADVLSFTNVLSPGTHVITVKAIDSQGASAEASATVAVLAGVGVPSAVIELPADGERFGRGEFVTLGGRATDPEDGVLSGASLAWSSSVQGALGTGRSLSFRLASDEPQIIRLEARDSDGNVGSDQITIEVVVDPD